MGRNYTALFVWFAINILIIILNVLLWLAARCLTFSPRRNKLWDNIVILNGIFAFLFGCAYLIMLHGSTLSTEYFSRKEPFIHHQYVTFEILNWFRIPYLLIFPCLLLAAILCIYICQEILNAIFNNRSNRRTAR